MIREDVLGRARERQRSEAESPAGASPRRVLRIVLEFGAGAEPVDPEKVARIIGERHDLDVTAELLFAPRDGGELEPELRRFVLVTVRGVDLRAIDGHAFELGYALADATGAVTAEPELGSDFYAEPPEPGLEGAIEFPGCWIDENQDIAGAQPYWAIDKIKAREAWKIEPPAGGKAKGEGVRVFQPDTGVADHVELERGMIDFAHAYDFIDNKPGATDPLGYWGNPGHGTGTASVVASRTGGKIAGSAPLARLTPLRAVERVVLLLFDHGRVAQAIDHARRNRASVITMSLGGAWSSSLRAAIDLAIRSGVIVLAAAGNCVRTVVWPARYEEVIAVAGVNIRDEIWRGSSRGEAVDISAPAEFVPRAKRDPSDGGGPHVVAGGQGTSFAVAITAGVAALWVGHHGLQRIAAAARGGTAQQLFVSLLRATARRPGGFDTASMGAGIVDAKALLNAPLALTVATDEAPAADPYQSLRSLIAETGGAEEAVAAIDQRRFAAELSYLALAKARAGQTSRLESAEGGAVEIPASATLRKAAAASGAHGLESLIGG